MKSQPINSQRMRVGDCGDGKDWVVMGSNLPSCWAQQCGAPTRLANDHAEWARKSWTRWSAIIFSSPVWSMKEFMARPLGLLSSTMDGLPPRSCLERSEEHTSELQSL